VVRREPRLPQTPRAFDHRTVGGLGQCCLIIGQVGHLAAQGDRSTLEFSVVLGIDRAKDGDGNGLTHAAKTVAAHQHHGVGGENVGEGRPLVRVGDQHVGRLEPVPDLEDGNAIAQETAHVADRAQSDR
jgi:hypothetical protein